jgi:hypothetical protein
MGANAQTTVPSFTIGQVLTADQQNQSARTGVPVFATTVERDAAFGGAGEKTLAEGQLCYLEDTNKVQYYDGAAWANLGSVTNVEAFTASGTFTPPAGVTYAIAHIRAGGGGVGSASSGTGGTSSVAFAGGTISATGGGARNSTMNGTQIAGATNSGQGATGGYLTQAAALRTRAGRQRCRNCCRWRSNTRRRYHRHGWRRWHSRHKRRSRRFGYVWIEYQV